MRNIKLTIEFDGTNYSGWQVQPSLKSIQNELENSIMVITKERVTVHSSGRTDAGVHAKKMTANFLIDKPLDLQKLRISLNGLLPETIAVTDVECVEESFHSRRSAQKKVYEYQILNREARSPFLKNYSWHIKKPLDIDVMQGAASYLIGEHDFAGFASVGTDVQSSVRTIHDITIQKNGDVVTLTFIGSGFLKQMVRNITGLLVQIGLGKFKKELAKKVLLEKQIKKPYITAPSRGLFLKDVIY